MIVVVGLSHKTASIGVRERLALPADAVTGLLDELLQQTHVTEAVVVSTCNRVEILAAGQSAEPTFGVAEAIETVLAKRAPGVEAHLYAFAGEAAVRHLFRVVSSLDSLVLGEPQILGQVKSSFELARKHGCVGAQLNRAVSHALRAAKRVRTETALGAGQVSVPSAAIDLAREIFGELKGRRALLVGSGQMGEAAAKLLQIAGAKLGVMGRNQQRVTELAAALQAEPLGFDSLDAQLSQADVIITTTSSPGFVITQQQVAAARKRRRGRSLFLIDLAVPRDVEPSINDLDGVFLYNVDDLSEIVAQTLHSRQREAQAAEEIVQHETRSYVKALSAEQATPTIVSLRQQFSRILEAEVERSLRSRLKHLGDEEREALTRMVDSAVNKLLHPATRHLRGLATDPEAQAELDSAVVLLKDVFNLPSDSAAQLSFRPPEPPQGAAPSAEEGFFTAGSTEPAPGTVSQVPSQMKVG